MPKGPHELRLDTYVANGNAENIAYSSQMWERGHTVLNNLADALESAKPHLLNRFGPQTGPAAVAAFETVAKNVRAQAAEMKRASTALTSAGHALEDAQHTHRSLGNAPASPPADPTQKAGESAGDFHARQHAAHQAQSGYAAEYSAREQKSQTAITTVDTHYTQAIKVMESIHGQPASHTGGSGGGGGGSIPQASLPTGGHHRSPTVTGVSWETGGSGHLHHHVDPPTTTTTTTTTTDPTTDPGNDGDGPGVGGDWPPGDHPGVPQGPGPYPPGSYPPGGPGDAPGGSLPPGATPTGPSSTMVGGLMTGGLVGGASGLSNALRGSAVTAAMTEEEMLAASRSSGTGAGAAGGRGAATGASGSARGGGGRGTGAGGRGDRGRKKKRPPGIDFFEDNEDWLDEDEAAPPVLH